MDLTTNYMGLTLKNPIIVSSSELTGNLHNIKRCAESGAGAVVLKSIFEEQILDKMDIQTQKDAMYFWYPEAADYISSTSREHGIEEYIQLIKDAKDCSDIPVIASVNCTTPHEWSKFAASLQNAGADGLELNISIIPFNVNISSDKIEKTYLDIVKNVKKNINIPVSVKIPRAFTNIASISDRLCKAGADGLVLFNRYYRPDIDIENLKVVTNNIFSAPEEITQTLRWIMILSHKIKCDLSASTGVHDYKGVVKMLLAGASAVQLCTTLYKNGIEYIAEILAELERWMKMEEVISINEVRGFLKSTEEHTEAFERVQFMKKTAGEIVTY